MVQRVCRTGKSFLRLVAVMLACSLAFMSACVQEKGQPTAPPQLEYPDRDTYLEQVSTTLGLIRGTLDVASQATRDLADGRTSREEFLEMAVSGRANLEQARADMSSVAPPSETILGGVTFEDMHDELMSGIEYYVKAFDEMIAYGNDGRISHIDKATDYIENWGDRYINSVTTELRIARE